MIGKKDNASRAQADAHAIATAELLAAAEAWGELRAHVNRYDVHSALRLRSNLCNAADRYFQSRPNFPVGGNQVRQMSDGLSPPGMDDGTGSEPVVLRSRDDGGFTPIIGAILCLGVVVSLFASCLWVVAWCPSCEFVGDGTFGGPAAPEGRSHIETRPDGVIVQCHPIVYLNGGSAIETGAETCSPIRTHGATAFGSGR